MPIEIGSEVEGRVTGVTKFGAFIELPEKKVGLVHISQVADNYVTDINKHLKLGDVIKVRVLGATKEGKYDLSIKQVGKPAWQAQAPAAGGGRRRWGEDEDKPKPGSFEDKITQFLKQSEEKLTDWKRNLEYKQTGKKKKLPK
ncbi:S1 RNA-binding domain-containing protein [Candidatus Saganbacteria bacterium]|uniref:S1 RNA-binding domain-containing protein n=1 Tax=Candidatus Saganbacteria bacterium TaxID=2575572 RepID=A0A9D6UM16_UNCSA|nr:S1 RNA-binding domain-containing protein [Candidatus Saganbacteria bacterium]